MPTESVRLAVYAGTFASQPLVFAHLADAVPGLDLDRVEVICGTDPRARLAHALGPADAAAVEDALGLPAQKNPMEMQPGDVPATWADATLLKRLTGYRPQTDVREGIARFVQWYREYYGR